MIYYIYATEDLEFVKTCKIHLKEQEVEYVAFDNLDTFEVKNASHLLVTGRLKQIKLLLTMAHQNKLTVGIVPSPKQKELKRTFALPSKIEDVLELALQKSEKPLDLLYCNGSIVLQEVVVGDAPPLDEFDSTLNGKSYFDRIKIFVRTMQKVKNLKHTEIKITDAKENEIKLSAIGVVGVEYNNNTFASKLISSKLSANDGKLSILVLSPTSIMQYMGYLFKSLVSHITPKTLPRSVGHIRSSKMYIESKVPLKVLVDALDVGDTPVMLEVEEKALFLNVGETFWDKQNSENNPKDSIKVDHLPSDEESSAYLSKAIPLFSHASQAQYTSLFTNLREESRLSRDFMVLLVLATMIATFGLFINSSSVIIGAMLLAPLMQPIVSLSMGVLRQDITLQLSGAKTIAIGVFSVLITSALVALFTPIEQLTSEMAGRLSPTILDLFVAIVSGAAAAYAKSNDKALGSLAGVSIAVALVPPIAVAGIGLGWADLSMFTSAFLLFVTNLVGIVFAAAFTFVLLGFSPLHIAKKGILTWMAIMAVIALPLYSSFSKMQDDTNIKKTLSNLTFDVGEHVVKLEGIELLHIGDDDELHCEVITTGRLHKEEKMRLKKIILSKIKQKFDIIVTFRYKL